MKTPGLLAALAAGAIALLFVLSGERGDREANPRTGTLPATREPAGDRTPEPAREPSKPAGERGEPTAARTALDPEHRPKAAGGRTRTRTLLGTVVWEEGPVAGAEVTLVVQGTPIDSVGADRDGRFELTFPLPQEDSILRVTQRGFATFERALGAQRLEGKQSLGNLFLQRGTVLSGIVVDEVGRPIQGVQVLLSTLRGVELRSGVGEETRTGVDGKFQFTAAPEGVVVLTARAKGFGTKTIDHRHLAGKEARLVLVPGRDLEVRVLDQNDAPVAGVRVTVRPQEPGAVARDELTDADGLATFEGLAAEEWNVRTAVAGYKPSGLASVRAGEGVVEMRLVAWPCATGKVVTPEGDPPPEGTLVHALPGSTRGDLIARLPGGTPVAADGSFRVGDLRVGEYRIHVFAPGYADSSSDAFRVGDVGDVDLGRITLQRGGGLELTLRRQGEPASGVRAEILSSSPLPAQLWASPRDPQADVPVSDAAGVLRMEGLTPGHLWLILRGENVVPKAVGPLSILSGGVARASAIELVPGARIRGTVKTTSGIAVSRARVQVAGPIASLPFLISDDAGRFETPPLPPGSYLVEGTCVMAGELVETEPLEVRLTAGQDAPADLVVPQS